LYLTRGLIWRKLPDLQRFDTAGQYRLTISGFYFKYTNACIFKSVFNMGGKKDKLRPGDLLGALCGDVGLTKEQVGKINVSEFMTYVALDRKIAEQALAKLSVSNIKGRQFKMRFIS